MEWLVINYNLPTEPSRHRVAIWRGLKKMGAVNIQQSMWILPNSKENFTGLQKIVRDIESNGGEALLMESAFLDKSHEERIISIFNGIRDEEYLEFIRECEKYLKEIDKEITNEKYTFSELEEEETEFDKLFSWYKMIEARDIFNSPFGNEALEILDKSKDSYINYTNMVYQKNALE